MLAAYIWHWWIGLVMLVAAGAATFGVIAGYLKKVSAPQHPGRRNRRDED